MKIIRVEAAVLEVPLDAPISDSQIRIDRWGLVVARVHLESGVVGYGYNSLAGTSGLPLQSLIENDLAPRLAGKELFLIKRLWEELYMRRHFLGVTGLCIQGGAAVEIALWDALAKTLDQPLWRILGGYEDHRLRTYNTDGGWLSLPLPRLVDSMRRLVDQGWLALKMKIGSPDPREDCERLKAVRAAIGPRIHLMADVNNAWDLPTAERWAPRLEEFDLLWLEEPLHPFDVLGHARLARVTKTPLMVGENIHSLHLWRDFIRHEAAGVVQADALKLGGVSNWLEAAALAHVHSLPVVPAAWDMMQLNAHLCASIPHAWMVEWIPWIRHIFTNPVTFEAGYLLVPSAPGAGTEIAPEAWERFRVA